MGSEWRPIASACAQPDGRAVSCGSAEPAKSLDGCLPDRTGGSLCWRGGLNFDGELKRLARDREQACEDAIAAIQVDATGQLLRQLRAYLSRQEDYKRIKGPIGDVIKLDRSEGGAEELECKSVEFESESRLEFQIRMEPKQPGWRIKQFRFHLHLPGSSGVTMVRVHLNPQSTHNSLEVPRCHLHIGRGGDHGQAHIPFPVMSPLLMLHLICEVIEPDFAAPSL